MFGILSDAVITSNPDPLQGRAVIAAELAANVAGWSLLVSIALLLGAVAAARYARGAWKAALDHASSATAQLLMAKASEEQREASKVSAWLKPSGDHIAIHVINRNDGPMFDVRWEVAAKASKHCCLEPCIPIRESHLAALPPYEAEETLPHRETIGPAAYVLGYEDEEDGIPRTFSGSANVKLNSMGDWTIWDGKAITPGLAIRLSFRDSANVRWVRGWDGRLKKL